MEVKDLSKVHHLVSDIFKWPTIKRTGTIQTLAGANRFL
jgi:hypothetical protein